MIHFESLALNPHSLPPIFAATLLSVLGISALIRDRGSIASFFFSLLMFFGSAWLFSYGAMYSVSSEAIAYKICQFETTVVVFIPVLLYLFALVVLQRLMEAWLALTVGFFLTLLLALSVHTTDWFLRGVYHYYWGYFPKYGPLGFAFIVVFFIFMVASVRLYWDEYKHTRFSSRKWQLKRLFIAFGITIFGAVDYLPALGIPVYPLGYVPVLLFIVILSQTIWKYRLQDITAAFAADQILSTMKDALLVIDPEGLIRIANEAACRLLKKNKREILLLPIWTVNEFLLTREQFEGLMEHGDAQNYETLVKHPETGQVLVDVTTSIVIGKEKEARAVLLIAKDISGLKKTEEALRRKNSFILLLQMIAVAANKAKDPDEVIRFALIQIGSHMQWKVGHAYVRSGDRNSMVSSKLWYFEDAAKYKNFRKMTEMTTFEKGHGTPGTILATSTYAWIPDLNLETHFVRRSICEEAGLKSIFAFPIIVENEVETVLEFFSDQFIDPEGSFFEIMSNISSQIGRVYERKRSEMKLKRAQEELEERVELRTQELLEANRKLKKIDEMKSTFMLTASHELRTPLTAMKGYLLLILQNKVGEITEAQREFLQHIKNAVERLERLVNELLSLTKIEMDPEALKKEKVELAEILDEEVMIFKAEAERKKITLELVKENELGSLECDEDRIREVVDNLISNALKYTPEEGRIEVKAKRTSEAIEILVRDNGIGIKPAYLDKIFDPFFRIHKKGLGGETSTGLGLALTKKIIQAHGGTISAKSEENAGTEFTVILPN